MKAKTVNAASSGPIEPVNNTPSRFWTASHWSTSSRLGSFRWSGRCDRNIFARNSGHPTSFCVSNFESGAAHGTWAIVAPAAMSDTLLWSARPRRNEGMRRVLCVRRPAGRIQARATASATIHLGCCSLGGRLRFASRSSHSLCIRRKKVSHERIISQE